VARISNNFAFLKNEFPFAAESASLAERQIHADMGCTRFELAVVIGVHPNTIANWEAGRSVPSADDLGKLAAALRRPLEFFYTEVTPPCLMRNVSESPAGS